MAKNISHAFIEILSDIQARGSEATTRGNLQKEILSNLAQIASPTERVIITPYRNNNIFALIAETLWVLAGRNDMAFLSHYLPRASLFSDDGETWRAAYGPRLRNWKGVDQLLEIVRLLREDPTTKRAVMVIFDPEQDYMASKDIPCNNWLHFMIREGKLHLNVTVRANDVIWGFGGINSFEWSILHELVACWLDVEVGVLSWFTGTIHLYERHYNIAKKIIGHFKNKTPYDFGIKSPKMTTPLAQFDEQLAQCFAIESRLRRHEFSLAYQEIGQIQDAFFRNAMQMLYVYNLYLHQDSVTEALACLSAFETNDFKVAGLVYMARQNSGKLNYQSSGAENAFLDYYFQEG